MIYISNSKLFKCGLCDFEAKNLESLELHLKTCEIYECEECGFVSQSLAGMKKHRSEKNTKCESSTVFHIKMDRVKEEIATCTNYKQSELFLKKFFSKKNLQQRSLHQQTELIGPWGRQAILPNRCP